ncbi:O-antigen ligase family protein [Actinoplanes sp. NPDC049548]|uniref:O-antigen ligase family protein n=1 Tax=Actinoplanes sp. NPDC049548 TaxID=3155152 RepID=UPI003429BE10
MRLRRLRLAGSAETSRESIQQAATVGGAAAAAGLGGVMSASVGAIGTIASYSLLIVLAMPAASIVTILVVAQEVSAARAGFENAWGSTFAYQVYFTTVAGIPGIALVAAAAALSGALWLFRDGNTVRHGRYLVPLAAFTALVVIAGLYHGVDPLLLVVRYCTFGSVLEGFLISAALRRQVGGARAVQWGTVLATAALLAVVLLVIRDYGIGFGVFYDSATPAVAGALALALLRRGSLFSWKRIAFFAGTVAILLVSLRRNIWLAAIGAIIIAFLFSRARTKFAVRIVAAAVIAIVAVQVMFPAVTEAVIDRFVAADLLSGFDTRDASTAGHFQDIAVGFDLALDRPWIGYGPIDNLPGLVVHSGFYVHNDALMAWLGFGAIGLIAYVATIIAGAVVALRVLSTRSSLVDATAAFFLLITPLAGISAAFLMSSYRWPLLYGICLGICAASTSNRVRQERALTRARASEPRVAVVSSSSHE